MRPGRGAGTAQQADLARSDRGQVHTREIAKKRHISPARVRQILACGVKVLAEDRVDPVQVGLELGAELELVLAEAKALAAEIPASNAAAKVGALKLVLVAVERIAQWQSYMGVLEPGSPRAEIDIRQVADMLFSVFEKHDVSIELQKDVAAALKRGDDPDDWLPLSA